MPRVYLVRHAEAAAGWTEDPDPGLSLRGRAQARAMAEALDGLGSRPIVSSPLRRARETAAELEARWGMAADVDPALGEVPTPDGVGVAERGGWLRRLLEQRWDDVEPVMRAWRDRLLDTVRSISVDTVIVSHYVAINTVAGAAGSDDRVVSFRPAHCSVTIVERHGTGLELVQAGADPGDLTIS